MLINNSILGSGGGGTVAVAAAQAPATEAQAGEPQAASSGGSMRRRHDQQARPPSPPPPPPPPSTSARVASRAAAHAEGARHSAGACERHFAPPQHWQRAIDGDQQRRCHHPAPRRRRAHRINNTLVDYNCCYCKQWCWCACLGAQTSTATTTAPRLSSLDNDNDDEKRDKQIHRSAHKWSRSSLCHEIEVQQQRQPRSCKSEIITTSKQLDVERGGARRGQPSAASATNYATGLGAANEAARHKQHQQHQQQDDGAESVCSLESPKLQNSSASSSSSELSCAGQQRPATARGNIFFANIGEQESSQHQVTSSSSSSLNSPSNYYSDDSAASSGCNTLSSVSSLILLDCGKMRTVPMVQQEARRLAEQQNPNAAAAADKLRHSGAMVADELLLKSSNERQAELLSQLVQQQQLEDNEQRQASAKHNQLGRQPTKQRQHNLQKQHQLAHLDSPQPLIPKTYPNNTLLDDLSKRHRHLRSTLWPRASQKTARASLALLEATCLPSFARIGAQQKKSSAPSAIDRQQQALSAQVSAQQQQLPTPQASPAGSKPAQSARCSSRRRRRRPTTKFAMPDSVRNLNSNLKQVDYERALGTLTSDVRFKLHLLLYGRAQTAWTLLTTMFCILIPVLLFAHSPAALVIPGALAVWLGLQLTGALLARNFRKKLDQMLEKAVAQANSYFMDYNLMLGVINVGGLLTKSRLCIPMLYFDTTQCRQQIESIISVDCEQSQRQRLEQQQRRRLQTPEHSPDDVIVADGQPSPHGGCLALDYSKFGLPEKQPTGGPSFAFAQSLARKVLLRYSQRWISYFDKQKLMFTDDKSDEPRHLSTGKCLCQFIEQHFRSADAQRQQLADEHRELAEQRQLDFGHATSHLDARQKYASDDEDNDHHHQDSEQYDDDEHDDDCCSTDELTDMLEGKQLALGAPENCVQIDINKLAQNEKIASSALKIYIPDQATAAAAALTVGNNANCSGALVPTLCELVSCKQRQLLHTTAPLALDLLERANSSSPVHTELSLDSALAVADQTHQQPLNPSLLINRNDQLIRRLKELLERRKNELSSAPNSATLVQANLGLHHSNTQTGGSWPRGATLDAPQAAEPIERQAADRRQQAEGAAKNLKKLLSQTTDGLSLLAVGKLKQSQPGFYVKQQRQQQALEIC